MIPRLFHTAVLLALSFVSAQQAIAADLEEQDRAGNRIEAFGATSAAGATDVHCTGDRRWCARIRTDDQTEALVLELFDPAITGEARPIGRYELASEADGESLKLWPRIVRMPQANGDTGEAALIGVMAQQSTGYSGGGASADRLSLIQVNTGFGHVSFREVLSVPFRGSVMIRACFSEQDMEQRAGACHDDYQFSAELTLRTKVSKGLPQFDYVTRATTFPGSVSRGEDSLANPPLTEKDLVTAVDDQCSYHRIVRFNPATERFEFDSPAPDCSDFTVP